MLRSLLKISDIETIFKENKLISIDAVIKENHISSLTKGNKGFKGKIKLNFKDSYKLLPMSLNKLIRAFSIDTVKLPFPHQFISKTNLTYSGPIPEYEKFASKSYTLKDYLNLTKLYKNKDWNLQKELELYIYNDVKALYEIIDKVSKTYYNNERINITKVISISSLALKTYLANYYPAPTIKKEGVNINLSKSNKIVTDSTKEFGSLNYIPIDNSLVRQDNRILIPSKEDYLNLRKAYYGGRVEVFKQYGENLEWYDCNSIFPYQQYKEMPGNNLIRSTDPNLENYFGVCYCKVTVPDNTYNPILPYKDSKGNNYNPTGT